MRKVLLGAVLLSVAATASTYDEVEFTCAVGGERFVAVVQMSMTSFGRRPDGKSYNTGIADLPECPGNGLVHYKDEFSRSEVAKLTPLVESAEYQSLRKTDTLDYRVYWLMSRMDMPSDQVAGALLAATWSSDGQAERKARYQTEFVEAAAALPAAGDSLWLKLRAANALRELGKHQQSDALLLQLDPAISALADSDERSWAKELAAGLRALNAEANRASEPATLVPDMIAAEICFKPSRNLSESEKVVCSSEGMKTLIAQRARTE